MKLLLGIGLTVLLLAAIRLIKHYLYAAVHRQERQKSEELS